jgi:transposase
VEGVLSVEDWAEIRRLHRAEGLPVKAIARVLGVSRNTVRAAVASDGPPRYVRAPKGSIVDVAEPRIRELLRAYPQMPATVIAERIGWERSIRVLSGRVAELRPVYLPPDPASRTAYAAGEIAQCDFWFPPVTLPAGFGQFRESAQLPVLTMVCGYSRWLSAVLIPSRHAQDLFAGWWQLIGRLGAVPRVLVWDGEGAIGRWRGGRSELTGDCQAFRGTLGTKVIICRPAARAVVTVAVAQLVDRATEVHPLVVREIDVPVGVHRLLQLQPLDRPVLPLVEIGVHLIGTVFEI